MAQFDVFVNPVLRAQIAYPFVVTLQSDVIAETREQIVAPLVPRVRIAGIVGRLMPVVRIDDADFVVLTHSLERVRRGDLGKPRCSVASLRSELLAAVDYLFFGV
jgi:toxin CcdB